MTGRSKTWLIWVCLILAFVVLYNVASNERSERFEDSRTFRDDVQSNQVAEVTVVDNEITVELVDGQGTYTTKGVVTEELEQTLSEQGVTVRRGKRSGSLLDFLVWLVIVFAGIALIVYFLRRRGGGNVQNIMTLRKSQARQISESIGETFDNVGGCTEAKQQLGDVIDFLRDPKRWNDAGARLPRGVLLEGPAGCGKTLLARAVAGETKARFYFVSASEFVEMFVGVGAARVRDMFETAAKSAPAIIFIDELDAVGRRRGSGIGSAHDEREQTLNQLLVCLDGFQNNERVAVIAATNRPDILDPALLRPGRFDRRIRIAELSRNERLEVLHIHTHNKTLGADVSLDECANRTDGFTGAQLESLANEAAILAVRRSRMTDGLAAEIRREDFEKALQPGDSKPRIFNKLDLVLIESASQLAEPTGKAIVRLNLSDGTVIQGEVLWGDAKFIKVRKKPENSEIIVAKEQINQLEVLAGTDVVDAEEVTGNVWATRDPGLA